MYKLHFGDCFKVNPDMPANAHICIITDPPYQGDSGKLLLTLATALGCKGNILAFCAPENQYFEPDERLFWIKTPSTKNYSKHCGRFVEIILVKRQGKVFNPLHWSQMTGVYDDRLETPPVHPYEKPYSLLERLIRIYSNPGDMILDPFCGSGRIGIAALRTGRSFIGIEQDPKWFELAKENIEKEKYKTSLDFAAYTV
jgi:DNA modification methylase